MPVPLDKYYKYDEHFKRVRGGYSIDIKAVIANPKKFIIQEEWLPDNLQAKILYIGCGWGDLLLSLYATGYRNLYGVDISSSQCAIAKQSLPADIKVIHDDAINYLEKTENCFDLITLMHVVEHLPIEGAIHLLSRCAQSLNPGGSVLVATPNMANIFSSCSRYGDITHVAGYTEWSLIQLLELAGYHEHRIIREKIFSGDRWRKYRKWYAPWRGICLKRQLLNDYLHRILYSLRWDGTLPSVYGSNLTIWSFVKR